MLRSSVALIALLFGASSLCAAIVPDFSNRVVISVREQKLILVQNGAKIATYPVSTSKYGLGDRWGSLATPLGILQVAQKIGDHAPVGAVFHNRRWTGEVLSPNAPGRDPVLTRIIWLRGLEPENAHAFRRCIYIHGTTEEKIIGRPASYGCVRMKSSDIAALYNRLPIGAVVQIVPDSLPSVSKVATSPASASTEPAPAKMILSGGAAKSSVTPERKSRVIPMVAAAGRGA